MFSCNEMMSACLPLGGKVINDAATGVVQVIEATDEIFERGLLLDGEFRVIGHPHLRRWAFSGHSFDC